MNFVDIQPNFSLDYAWTSPSRSPTVMNTTKSSKTSRKQNRCCDQCRKGKRACDAAILEDTLLDNGKAGERPTTFHYSGEWVKASLCAVLMYQMSLVPWLHVAIAKRQKRVAPLSG